ncbi:MAG: cold shock domain-containing protein [Saprospiraceae bacterium]|nr:cold shock domain-containing protein [Saprospiraceae bacterium]
MNIKRKGIVQFFLQDRGFGYIRDLSNREEFHVKAKHTLQNIQKGDQVLFRVAEDKHGLYAIEVEVVEKAKEPEK